MSGSSQAESTPPFIGKDVVAGYVGSHLVQSAGHLGRLRLSEWRSVLPGRPQVSVPADMYVGLVGTLTAHEGQQ
jgi:hypothetical protein